MHRISLYCRLLEPAPAGFICLDRDLSLVYPVEVPPGLPLDALVDIGRRVMANNQAEADVRIEGLQFAMTCVPLQTGGSMLGVVFVIDNGDGAKGRELVMLADEPVAVFDRDSTLVFSNVTWQAGAKHREVGDAARAALARACRGEVVELSDLEMCGMEVTGVAGPYVTALGLIRGALVICQPLASEATDRARERFALAEAERASRDKDRFIATIAHELRSPVATMLLWEKVLRDESIDPATRTRSLDAIHESAVTQSRLVADLFDISRAISGKLHVDKRAIVLDTLLQAAADDARAAAIEKGVELHVELAASDAHVRADPSRMRQVFANVVANAIRFTDRGGTVTVRSAVRGSMLAVSVSDTGRGIAPELLPHVFDPYWQSDAHSGGLGLGLAIAKQIVSLHGGTLVAESEGPGRGSTFVIELRLERTQEVIPVRTLHRLDGVHVLLVDDDTRILEALRMLLERAGAVVETAGSASAGYAAARNESFDVVVSDVAMPDGDGCSMMRQIREHERGGRVPAVAITAHVVSANRNDVLAAGFDRYVTKPLDIDHLISTIAGLVRAR